MQNGVTMSTLLSKIKQAKISLSLLLSNEDFSSDNILFNFWAKGPFEYRYLIFPKADSNLYITLLRADRHSKLFWV